MKKVIIMSSTLIVSIISWSLYIHAQDIDKEQDVISIENPHEYFVDDPVPEEPGKLVAVKQLIVASDAKWLCELFMLKLVNDTVQDAFNELQPYFPIPETEFAMLEMQTYQQLDLVKSRYGTILGYSLVEEQTISDTVLRFVYLLRFERHAIRWMFYFYKPDDTWFFNEFYFDDKIREFFE